MGAAEAEAIEGGVMAVEATTVAAIPPAQEVTVEGIEVVPGVMGRIDERDEESRKGHVLYLVLLQALGFLSSGLARPLAVICIRLMDVQLLTSVVDLSEMYHTQACSFAGHLEVPSCMAVCLSGSLTRRPCLQSYCSCELSNGVA